LPFRLSNSIVWKSTFIFSLKAGFIVIYKKKNVNVPIDLLRCVFQVYYSRSVKHLFLVTSTILKFRPVSFTLYAELMNRPRCLSRYKV
jgi:hypothetical protein